MQVNELKHNRSLKYLELHGRGSELAKIFAKELKALKCW